MRRSALVSLVSGLAFLAGCGSSPPLLQGAIKVDPTTNPDVQGRPSPVIVRVYELKSPTTFNGADFFSLFDKEQETLGGDLIGREEYQMRPAETKPYRRQLQPDTKFIGVAAAFRDLEHSQWRQAVAVPPKRTATVSIAVEARAITVAVK